MEVLPEGPAGFPVNDFGPHGLDDDEPEPTTVAEVVTVKIKVLVAGTQVLIPDDAPAAIRWAPHEKPASGKSR